MIRHRFHEGAQQILIGHGHAVIVYDSFHFVIEYGTQITRDFGVFVDRFQETLELHHEPRSSTLT